MIHFVFKIEFRVIGIKLRMSFLMALTGSLTRSRSQVSVAEAVLVSLAVSSTPSCRRSPTVVPLTS
jgi:hypothetical protein